MSDNSLETKIFYEFADLLEELKNGVKFERGDVWKCAKSRLVKSVFRNRLRRYWIGNVIEFEKSTGRCYIGTIKDIYLDSFDNITFLIEDIYRSSLKDKNQEERFIFEIHYEYFLCTNSFRLWEMEPYDIEIYI